MLERLGNWIAPDASHDRFADMPDDELDAIIAASLRRPAKSYRPAELRWLAWTPFLTWVAFTAGHLLASGTAPDWWMVGVSVVQSFATTILNVARHRENGRNDLQKTAWYEMSRRHGEISHEGLKTWVRWASVAYGSWSVFGWRQRS